jgi:hypothetical protein
LTMRTIMANLLGVDGADVVFSVLATPATLP